MNGNQIAKAAEALLVGRRIVGVRFLTDEEQRSLYWFRKAPVIELDDGNFLFPSADDEGNDAGALFTSFEQLLTIPVLR